jgi:hypothetical protein
LAPGQGFQIALVADENGREALLLGRTLNVRITTSAGSVEKRDLKPVAIRNIKATGADMVLRVLEAGGIRKEDKATLEQASSMVSFAVFDPVWGAPALAKAEDIQIEAILAGGAVPPPSLKPVTLKLRPWSSWQAGPDLDKAGMEKLMSGFHEDPKPGRLIPLLKAAARTEGLQQHSIYSFLVTAFREYPMAREEGVRALPTFDPLCRWAFLLVLRLGGEDIAGMMDGLPEDAKASLKEVRPLRDPRIFTPFRDPVDPQQVGGVGIPMDQCWGGWMATGDPSYLQGLVGLLQGAPDFPVFEAWQKAKGGVKGLNARAAQGLAYQIAGWSLYSFQRTDPQVADWLLFWQQDPHLSQGVRDQIKGLPGNPAFRRGK